MAQVTDYSILFYGTSDGYSNNRAQIHLSNNGTSLGFVRFHDDGMTFPADSESGSIIYMHLPSSAYAGVIDMLRNESPINFYFASSHAFLGTSTEGVGEGES
ncbi:hypothetical protein G6O69_34110 [Pseudenhygromyxa sp. WMMC2535]|uniref:hypothetical protein n=1 Tax=Pseudenhygromyxa sp. WMMC2535 TaxID=2712867 RepID=UPI001553B204|nr:hypothetical protein [Pseudenhygromyxa sp. WMMC2535]NVB42906.1 hypothetical protein [Pseudenhygromyxa sp. WMMC2535]